MRLTKTLMIVCSIALMLSIMFSAAVTAQLPSHAKCEFLEWSTEECQDLQAQEAADGASTPVNTPSKTTPEPTTVVKEEKTQVAIVTTPQETKTEVTKPIPKTPTRQLQAYDDKEQAATYDIVDIVVIVLIIVFIIAIIAGFAIRIFSKHKHEKPTLEKTELRRPAGELPLSQEMFDKEELPPSNVIGAIPKESMFTNRIRERDVAAGLSKSQSPMSQPPMSQPPMSQPPMSQPPMSQPPMSQSASNVKIEEVSIPESGRMPGRPVSKQMEKPASKPIEKKLIHPSLIDFIRKCLARGYTDAQLRTVLQKHKWRPDVIDANIAHVKTMGAGRAGNQQASSPAKVEYSKVNSQLMHLIDDAKRAGMSDKDLMGMLSKTKYPKEVIKQTLAFYKKRR